MNLNTNTMTKLIWTMSVGILSLSTFAQEGQNLISNPGFESVGKAPKRLGSIESAEGWVSPTGVRADLFTSSKLEEINVPENVYGKEHPKEGGNYAGIVGYSYGDKIPRSYVMTKIDVPLKKGMRYCVKFNLSLAEASKYASNNIGAKLSNKPFGTDSKLPIIDDPSLVHYNNDLKIMSARYDWTEVCGVVVAGGGEKYLTIGNFNSDGETKSERMKKDPNVKTTQIVAAYYYIDDVTVRLLNDDEQCDCQAEESAQEYSTTIYQKVFNVTDDMTVQEKIEKHEIFFAFGRDKLTTEGQGSLDLIASLLKANPAMKLQINGHNNAMEDSVGIENDYYAGMDNKRIGAVMTYLMEKGIPENRIIFTRKGSEEPSNDTNEEDDDDLIMAKNRRATFNVR
jgi:outer membrane protein OmpA-like peptidoglycan-associated protein